MEYTYTAKTDTGESVSGVLTAENLDEVQQQLREKNQYMISATPSGGALAIRSLPTLIRRPKVPKRDVLTLTTQLAIMTRAGMDLAGTLKSLSDQCSHTELKDTLETVHEDVTGGKCVSDALGKHPHVFGGAYVASVAAGEESGRLPDVLNRLAEMQKTEMRNRSTIVTLMSYPLLLGSVSILVTFGLVCFVLPKFATVFDQFDTALPAITQILLGISTELRTRYWLWGPLVIAIVIGCTLGQRSKPGRKIRDRILLNAYGIRDVTRALFIGRTFRLLGLMLESGVPLLEGLRLTKNSIQNSLYQELFDTLEEDILNGRGLGNSLSSVDFVPPAAAEMIQTAEKTGTLAMVTRLMGDHFEEEGQAKLREMATLLEPLIIIVMGVVVAVVVLSVMLPMFNLATLAK